MHGTGSADCGDHPRKARLILIVCSRGGKATAKARCLPRNTPMLLRAQIQTRPATTEKVCCKQWKQVLSGCRPTTSACTGFIFGISRELHLSTRTLERRLTAERAKSQQLMEEARRELAQHYLLHSSLELNETAYLLGYEDANSFFRAFHQWEGTSPGEWRTVHAHRASSNHASAPVASSTL